MSPGTVIEQQQLQQLAGLLRQLLGVPGAPVAGGATAYDFVRRWFGGPVRPVWNARSIGTSVSTPLNNDPTRVAIIFINLSTANNIWVAPEIAGVVSSTNGIQLSAGGGWRNLRVDQDADLPAHTWNAIAAGASSTLIVGEVLIG